MNIEQLSEQFYELVAPSMPNEWDVEESLQSLIDEDAEVIATILNQVPIIWPVSHNLCFTYLANAREAIPHITTENIDIWVRELLAQYENGGLHQVQVMMQDVQHFLPRLQGRKGVRLDEVRGKLQPYVNGLVGREMPIIAAGATYTDTHSIFVPPEIDFFADRDDAFFLYKFILSFQWASLKIGTIGTRGFENTTSKDIIHPLQIFFASAKDPLILMQMYHFFETVRAIAHLRRELPGLIKKYDHIASQLSSTIDTTEETADFITRLQHILLSGKAFNPDQTEIMQAVAEWVDRCRKPSANVKTSQRGAKKVAALVAKDPEKYPCEGEPLIFQGELRLKEVMAAIQKERAQQQQLFIETFASYLTNHPDFEAENQNDKDEKEIASAQADTTTALIMNNEHDNEHDAQSQTPILIQLDGKDIELNEELAELVEEIVKDLGHLPAQYISSAVGKAGPSKNIPNVDNNAVGGPQQARFTYDEWDFRRKGYRKNWCVLVEKQLDVVRSTFAEDTMTKYRHQISMLKHQFEMLQTTDRFVHRQKEGDDIDFDAVVESLSDAKAGYPPSDRLFIRLMKDQRDIAVLFLVDMSNSTEGWVGKSIKEALILISEAMAMLNDRYGIYGFSGMRRLRCEVFPIKSLDQKYNSDIRQRIAGISPKEYTRMAPAIRHMISIFKKVDAKLRLLVVLSDGKPEDYDDYKGEYAIKDTRHALFEAKSEGIHPFCITIDKHAQTYMQHMYGPANYIFVDNLKRLPILMPEIYRTLTT